MLQRSAVRELGFGIDFQEILFRNAVVAHFLIERTFGVVYFVLKALTLHEVSAFRTQVILPFGHPPPDGVGLPIVDPRRKAVIVGDVLAIENDEFSRFPIWEYRHGVDAGESVVFERFREVVGIDLDSHDGTYVERRLMTDGILDDERKLGVFSGRFRSAFSQMVRQWGEPRFGISETSGVFVHVRVEVFVCYGKFGFEFFFPFHDAFENPAAPVFLKEGPGWLPIGVSFGRCDLRSAFIFGRFEHASRPFGIP